VTNDTDETLGISKAI